MALDLDKQLADRLVEGGAREFLTGEDCTVLIARGPAYTWERLRLVASIAWQESRVVLPHYGYDDAWFTAVSPGARLTNGSLIFYRKAGDIHPLHTTSERRDAQQNLYKEELADQIRDRNRALLQGARRVGQRGAQDIAAAAQANDRLAWSQELSDELRAPSFRAVGGERGRLENVAAQVAASFAAGGTKVPGRILSNIPDSGARGVTYTEPGEGGQSIRRLAYRNALEEPVDLMVLLSYPHVLNLTEQTFFAAVLLRSVYFTGAASSVQNVGVEALTESYSFVAQKTLKLEFNGN
jgi:hypothetical protein